MANTLSQAIKKMTFRERKDGLLEGRACYNGERKSTYGHTKAECQNKAKKYFEDKENQELKNSKSDYTLGEYMEKWLETYHKAAVDIPTFRRSVSIYNTQVKPHRISKMPINQITTDDIQRLINEFAYGEDHETPEARKERMRIWKERQERLGLQEGMTPQGKRAAFEKEQRKIPLLLAQSGLKKLKNLINPCMEYAVDNNLIKKNPCTKVVIPKENTLQVKTKEQFALSDEEIIKFKEEALRTAKNGTVLYRDAAVFVLMIATGMRVGEACALKWSDIYEEAGYIRIHSTIQTGEQNEKKVKDGTKTNDGRLIPLNDNIRGYLKLLRDYDKVHNIKSDLVVCTRNGTPQTEQKLNRALKRLCKRAGIEGNVTPHTLRHTFGSTLIRKGVGIEIVSRLMGHANIMVTYNKYIHVIKEQEAKAMTLTVVI